MSLEPSSSDATTSRDSVDHLSEENGKQAVNTIMLNKNTESRCYKYDDEVFTKYKDYDLTQTEKNASNKNVNDGDICGNPTTLSNEKSKKNLDEPKIIGDVPDSWSVAMSIKRALWPSEVMNLPLMLNTGHFDSAYKKATQIVIYVEKKLEKRNALLTLLKETKDCQGIIIYARENRQASFIAAYLSELDYSSAYIGSDYEIPKQKMALEEFKKKKVKILVATLAASVEKDLSDVKMVVNFDLPDTGEEYLQRIGRVGQSEIPDKIVSFFDSKSDSKRAPYLLNILKDAGQLIPAFLPYCCVDEEQMMNKETVEDEKQATNPN